MKAVQIDQSRKDSPDALHWSDVSLPQLGERLLALPTCMSLQMTSSLTVHPTLPSTASEQVLVKVKAFGLNRMDLMQRRGMYPVPPGASPVLGVEFSGTIADSNNGQGGWKEGDEVFGLALGGAYAEYIAVQPRLLVKKPKELSWAQAAGRSSCDLWALVF